MQANESQSGSRKFHLREPRFCYGKYGEFCRITIYLQEVDEVSPFLFATSKAVKNGIIVKFEISMDITSYHSYLIGYEPAGLTVHPPLAGADWTVGKSVIYRIKFTKKKKKKMKKK